MPLIPSSARHAVPRGSPCALPEETLEGYEKAARDGADYLEMDVVRLVVTSDPVA